MKENELLTMGYRKYRGEELDVYFKLDLCIHSAVCVKGNRRVFNVRKRPWIFPDGEYHKERLMELIDACPSGALKYIVHTIKQGENIMRVEHDENRIYLMNEEEIEAGEILFETAGDEILVVNHTYVHDGFSGQGVGKKLITAMVNRAREEGRKIRPVCEFAKAILEKNEDFHDVLEK